MAKKIKKFVLVSTLIENFEFEILNKGNIKNKIFIPSLNRTGLELASKEVYKNITTAVLWSGNEDKYLKTLKSKQEVSKVMSNVISMKPPVIIVTTSFTFINELVELAKQQKIPVLRTSLTSFEMYISVAPWINEQLAEFKTVHGTLVSIYGTGVLIQGQSGVGKSETALELVKKGHTFVADDAVDIGNIGGKLIGKANAVAAKYIEVRGIGILNVPRMFGFERIKKSTTVDVVVELFADEKNSPKFERLGNELKQKVFQKVKVPLYQLPVTAGRKISDLIEVAVADLKLREEGYNSANEYIQNFEKVKNNA